jgi:hypothetical protein
LLSDSTKINGYWEVDYVILPDGEKKDYKINETNDFFEIKNNVGFRKKVTPQYDGTYLINEQQESVRLIEKNHHVFMEYKTLYAKWEEEILVLSGEELVLKNAQKLEYHYKRPVIFTVK